jgi:hypothetical protein
MVFAHQVYHQRPQTLKTYTVANPLRNERDIYVQSTTFSHCVHDRYAPEEWQSPKFSLITVCCFLHVSRQNASFCTVLATSIFPSFIGLHRTSSLFGYWCRYANVAFLRVSWRVVYQHVTEAS